MYITNISFFVEPKQESRWIDLVQGKLLPLVESSGLEIVAFSRVLTEEHQGVFTYSLLVAVEGMPEYNKLVEELLGEYHLIAQPMFGEGVTTFTTLLKKIAR